MNEPRNHHCTAQVALQRDRQRRAITRLLAALAVVALGHGVVNAQLLADVMVATAISATFDSNVRFPSGSLTAQGPGTTALIATVPGSDAWTDWEVYVARGVAANLQPAFVHNIATAFAVAGYFESERSETTVSTTAGPRVDTRVLFEGGDGTTRLLYVIRSDQEVAWLIARSR